MNTRLRKPLAFASAAAGVVLGALLAGPASAQPNPSQDYCAEFSTSVNGPPAVPLVGDGTQILTGICSNTPQGELPTVNPTIVVNP